MITVFTPTYNRAYILPKLYESLSNQTIKNFEWLIVDDGSTDDTKNLIEDFKLKAEFKIQYIYQENQGKHVAINTALKNITSKYFFIIDSDDQLLEKAIFIIYSYLLYFEKYNNIACLAFPYLKKNKDDSSSKLVLPFKELITKPYILNSEYGIYGEFTLLFLTDIHKKYLYPQFENEKFIKESLIYNRIFKKYNIMYVNESIVAGEYLEEGLSLNINRILKQNPKGAALVFREKMNNRELELNKRINLALVYWDYISLYEKSFIKKIKGINGLKMKLLFIYRKLRK